MGTLHPYPFPKWLIARRETEADLRREGTVLVIWCVQCRDEDHRGTHRSSKVPRFQVHLTLPCSKHTVLDSQDLK